MSRLSERSASPLYRQSLARFTSPDPLSEKIYSFSTQVFCENNPLLKIDPTGEISLKFSLSFSMNSGFIGAERNNIKVEAAPWGGAKNEWKLEISFDSDTQNFSIGLSYTKTNYKSSYDINAGPYEFKNSEYKSEVIGDSSNGEISKK